jgi:hypothetical protein
MKFSPHRCYLIPHSPKYSPQHPILKHPQLWRKKCFVMPMAGPGTAWINVWLWNEEVPKVQFSDLRATLVQSAWYLF